jgi:peptide-methionine (S)-S-oxide reductase
METATLGGGCFWCMEAVYKELRGVESVVSGYMGGHLDRPSYQDVCGGDTGHAEVIQLAFDPAVIRYRDILEVFFSTHDPTTLNRQGDDVGTQYRSAIFWHDEEQRSSAAALIEELDQGGKYREPIVTELVRASSFWPAEDYHQNYLRHHPNEPYCAYVVQPKVEKFRAHFGSMRKPD